MAVKTNSQTKSFEKTDREETRLFKNLQGKSKNGTKPALSKLCAELEPKMGALRKLITEENNGSRDATTAGSSRDADSR